VNYEREKKKHSEASNNTAPEELRKANDKQCI
jgi:hypothetical protein